MLKKHTIIIITFLSIFFLSCTGTKIIKNEKIEELNLELVSLNFYLGSEIESKSIDKIYSNTFNLNKTNFIWYDLLVENRSGLGFSNKKSKNVVLNEIWLNSEDNTIISSIEKNISFAVDKKLLNYTAGFSNYPDWHKGNYLLQIFVNNKKICSREFVIE